MPANPTTVINKPSPVIKPEDVTMDDLQHLAKNSFALWSLTSGAKVDGYDVEFDKHRYLLPIYLDNSTEIVWQKSAQVGATIYILLRALWWLDSNPGRKAGLYFPTKEGVENLSKDRLTPLIESIPSLKDKYDPNDKLGLRKIGASSFYLYHLGGVASKDSVPLDYLSFDEVRLCKDQDIDQAMERISASPHKFKVLMSTAGAPNQDINLRFQYGTQHCWRSRCGCPDGCDLGRTFPDCVVSDDSRRPGEVYLRCPKCKWEIKDPQNGRYVPMNPGGDYHSYSVSQLASKTISTKEIWTVYRRTTNMKEFYNAKLGLPYIDESARGVTMDALESSVEEAFEWAKPGKCPDGTVMGVDQGAGYVYVVIADQKDGKKRIRHLEVVESLNPIYKVNGLNSAAIPFKRLRELMKEFNVKFCVLDAMPNINEALAFAQEFPSKVFLAYYNSQGKEVVQWGDRKKHKEVVRKAGPLLKFKYLCVLSRFASLSVSLGEWEHGNVLMPDPDKLVQMCGDERSGEMRPEAPGRRLFSMLTRLFKQYRVTNEETGEGKWEWTYAGMDPHFAHAWNYCNMGLERMRRTFNFSFV